ncbi:MAG: flavodoxin domain-containing protein [Candidatus Omnitrophica bacterium]|nr:flavodoxin domain-containing protein [Candidatus Omnitrophota bacterium]
MKKLAVVYYSRTGNTESMAEAIAEGARKESEVSVDVEKLENFPAEKMLEYDGLIVGSPTYYGSMAYQVKKLFDDSVVFHGKLAGKVGGAFSSAANVGGGNETTITGILNAMLIHGMIIEGTSNGDHFGPVAIGAPDTRANSGCKALGKRVAALVTKLT